MWGIRVIFTNEDVGSGAPRENRTPTPERKQILSLPRLPIPPQGHGDRLGFIVEKCKIFSGGLEREDEQV